MDFDREKKTPLEQLWSTSQPHTLTPIFKNQTEITKASSHDKINTIDTAINSEIAPRLDYGLLGTRVMSEKDCFDLLKIVAHYFNNIADREIAKLAGKNKLFKEAIEYFITLAQRNFDKVTLSTLDTITNPEIEQPVRQLNLLVPAIKKYVMKSAYNKIDYLCQILFKGHTEKINGVDIHAGKNKALSWADDGELILWQLETGTLLHIFSEKGIQFARFNETASLIAAALILQQNPPKSQVKIWNTDSKQLLHMIEDIPSKVTSLAFLDMAPSSPTNTLTILEDYYVSNYELSLNKKPIFRGRGKTNLMIKDTSYYPTDDGDYKKATALKNNDTVWYAAINSPTAYFCGGAIINAQDEKTTLEIQKHPKYMQLTKPQKDVVNVVLDKKLQTIKATPHRHLSLISI